MLNFAKTYELPLSRDYVRHWGLTEAVREILQNALDSDSPFEYELDDSGMLRIHSRNALLTPSTLLLGQTTKAGQSDKIGSFGEGYKIALLVLAREGREVRVRNGDRVWIPEFRRSRQFDAEVLCIRDHPAYTSNQGLTFEVDGLSPDESMQIRESCLHMQGNLGEVIEVRQGRILLNRPGRLYVGGLFVCETQLKFGYDCKPEFLRLERDRQTVSGFDLQYLTKDMWFDSERYDEIAELLKDEVPDLSLAEYGAPEMVKEACYRLFQREHPGAVVAKDQKELDALIEKGMTKVEFVGSTYGSMIQKSRSYGARHVVVVKTPEEVMEEWLEENKEELSTIGIANFRSLQRVAKTWRNK
jgi:hypothetical protein